MCRLIDKMIDLRSDTVTKPTSAMRQVMAQAQVGDDVLGDDPTVIELEKRVAEILGKQAALYLPSGTMSNQIAIKLHTQPGDEILIDVNAHLYYYESGAPAVLSQVMTRLLPGRRGIFSGQDVRNALRVRNMHFPPTSLLCLENTHNRGGGSIWPLEQIQEVAAAGRETDLKLHLDGARLWNASAATGIPEKEYAQYFDTISVCFSKGLGAPVGSCLAGSAELIYQARRWRKMFGGAMRQAGIIAAGALYALEHNRQRLTDDHKNAAKLALALADIPSITLDATSVQTNIVIFRVSSIPADQLAKRLYENGVYVLATGKDTIRAVTNLNVTSEDIDEVVSVFSKVLTE